MYKMKFSGSLFFLNKFLSTSFSKNVRIFWATKGIIKNLISRNLAYNKNFEVNNNPKEFGSIRF